MYHQLWDVKVLLIRQDPFISKVFHCISVSMKVLTVLATLILVSEINNPVLQPMRYKLTSYTDQLFSESQCYSSFAVLTILHTPKQVKLINCATDIILSFNVHICSYRGYFPANCIRQQWLNNTQSRHEVFSASASRNPPYWHSGAYSHNAIRCLIILRQICTVLFMI